MDHDSGASDRESVPAFHAGLPATAAPDEAPGDELRRLEKKRAKVRSAWIAFAGRILAQLIGAIATVLLGLYVVRTYGVGERREAASSTAAPGATEMQTAATVTTTPAARLSLVVLPLVAHVAGGSQDYVADGLTEALIADLSHIEDLRVISRTSSMAYRQTSKTAPTVARELGVDFIVEGSLARNDTRVLVTVQLIDARADTHLWAQRYERPAGDLLAVQTEVAMAIATELHAVITPRQEQRRASLAGVPPAAYDEYLQGRHAFHRRTPADLQEAERRFQAAVARAPRFALAHAALAETYCLMALDAFGATAARPMPDRAERAAQAALALDSLNADAHLALAMVHQRRDWDWAAAERQFRRALDLHESHPTAHQWFAILLAEQRRDAEAVLHADRAVALDPAAAPVLRTAGLVRLYAGHLDEAQRWVQRSLMLAPGDGVSILMLASIHLAQGRGREARQDLARMRDVRLDDQRVAMLVHAAVLERDRPTALRLRREYEQRPPPRSLVADARIHLAFGEHEALIQTAGRAVAARTQLACALLVHPVFVSVRSHPQLLALAREAGLT